VTVNDFAYPPKVDSSCSKGKALLGYNHSGVKTAVPHALEKGIISGADTEHQVALVLRLRKTVPCAELAR